MPKAMKAPPQQTSLQDMWGKKKEPKVAPKAESDAMQLDAPVEMEAESSKTSSLQAEETKPVVIKAEVKVESTTSFPPAGETKPVVVKAEMKAESSTSSLPAEETKPVVVKAESSKRKESTAQLSRRFYVASSRAVELTRV